MIGPLFCLGLIVLGAYVCVMMWAIEAEEGGRRD